MCTWEKIKEKKHVFEIRKLIFTQKIPEVYIFMRNDLNFFQNFWGQCAPYKNFRNFQYKISKKFGRFQKFQRFF